MSRIRVAPFVTLVCLLALTLAAGCKRAEKTATVPAEPPVAAAPAPAPAPVPFRVAAIEIGSAIDAGKRVSAPATAFAPGDTIYAAVVTEGSAPSVALQARWTYEDGQLVAETTETIAPTGPAATEFHISKPSGWPAGRYKIEIIANGAPAGSREFEVR